MTKAEHKEIFLTTERQSGSYGNNSEEDLIGQASPPKG